jgi:hypothetical protein
VKRHAQPPGGRPSHHARPRAPSSPGTFPEAAQEAKVFLLLFLQKKQILSFFKNTPAAWRNGNLRSHKPVQIHLTEG